MIAAAKHSDLIYDVGLHRGEDTAFYLSRGFRVVAFEANPELAGLCADRFAEAIARGRLTIVPGAIVAPVAGEEMPRRVRFYRNDKLSVWGTLHADWVERNVKKGAGSSTIEVPAVDFATALEQHGIPHYLKIDIEGSDLVCVEALRRFRERPDYLSLESSKTSFANIRREIELLSELGYDAFQAVEQSGLRGSSGPFGAELGGEWQPRKEILRRYRAIRLGYWLVGDDGLLANRSFRGSSRLEALAMKAVSRLTGAPVPGWYDTHARHASVLSGTRPRPV